MSREWTKILEIFFHLLVLCAELDEVASLDPEFVERLAIAFHVVVLRESPRIVVAVLMKGCGGVCELPGKKTSCMIYFCNRIWTHSNE